LLVCLRFSLGTFTMLMDRTPFFVTRITSSCICGTGLESL
jgi:hypothetical protein